MQQLNATETKQGTQQSMGHVRKWTKKENHALSEATEVLCCKFVRISFTIIT